MFEPKEDYKRRPAYKDDEGKIISPSEWRRRPYEEWLRPIEFAEALYERHVPVSNRWVETIHYDTPGVYMDLRRLAHWNHPQPIQYLAILRIIMPKAAATEKGGESFNDAIVALAAASEAKETLTNHLQNLESLVVIASDLGQEELKSFKIQIVFGLAGYREDPSGFSDLTVDVVRDWPNILAAVVELKEKWQEAGSTDV